MRIIHNFITIISLVLFYIGTAFIVVFHIKAPFTFYIALYDVLFVLYIFILPKIFGKKIYSKEDGMVTWYLYTGQWILIFLSFYIINFVYKI